MWRSITKYLLNSIIFGNRMQSLPAGQNALYRLKQEVSLQGYRHHTPTAFKISIPISTIKKVEAVDKQRCITVHWDDGNHSQYPYVWLRDNCQCPQCFLPSAKARKLPIEDLDMNISADKVISTDAKISVVWPDQHVSEFDSNWLKARSFAQITRKEKQEELFLTEN
ncbi:gamma-butyrobetaine dioxygenase-like [Rhincodon typus]|uniref:gamma-butyrobetaine dioxygenase-like n=1 Tax=Rhincodon typus TaxID=259920 RepID=UPI002030A1A0|nr:gamma-butyrobetaine dioxygenase-like [Rhincodon typus]